MNMRPFVLNVMAVVLCTSAGFAAENESSDKELLAELKEVDCKIVCETFRDGNWEIVMRNADGSDEVNLTRTTDVNELNPHVSPDGTKVAFVVDKGKKGPALIRSVYYMNIDGTGRKLVANNARQECWKADSSAIAYVKNESDKFS